MLSALLAACANPAEPIGVEPTSPATEVVVELPSPLLEVGEVRQASARVVDSLGNRVATRFVTWSSENVSIATVDQDGMITAVGVGETKIVATSAELVSKVGISVVAAGAASIALSSPKHIITWGATTRVVADVRDRFGDQLPPTQVTFSSSWPEGISVDQDGIVTGHLTGSAWIRAQGDGAVDSLRITSAPPGVTSVEFVPGWGRVMSVGSQAFPGVVARNAAGDVLGEFLTRLSSSDSAIIRPDLFILKAVAPGVASISSVVQGIDAAIQVQVVDQPRVEKVTLSTSTPEILLGDAAIIFMETRDGQGNLLSDRAKDDVIQWWGHGYPAHLRWNGDTLVLIAGVPGPYQIERRVENREGPIEILVRANGNVGELCQRITGAMLLGDDGQYLGHLVGSADPRSIQDLAGRYGSHFSSTSVFSPSSIYSKLDSPLSAMSPWATRPPRIVKNGEELARMTVNTGFAPRVNPAVAQACTFP